MGQMSKADVAKLLEELESQVISAADLVKMNILAPRVIVDGLIAEGFTFLAGLARQGKSSLSLGLAAAVAEGKPFLGRKTHRSDVLLLSLELGKRTTHVRLKRMEIIVPGNLAMQFKWPRDGEGGVEALDAWLDKRPKVGLVVIDAFDNIRSGVSKRGGGNVRLLERQEVASFRDVAIERHVAFVVVHQLSKDSFNSRRDPIEMLSGTMGLASESDCALILRSTIVDGMRRWKLHVKPREFNFQTLVLKGDKTKWTWSVATAEDLERGYAKQIMKAVRALGEPVGPTEVRKETKIKSLVAVRLAMSRMGNDGRLRRLERGKYVLPDQHDEEDA